MFIYWNLTVVVFAVSENVGDEVEAVFCSLIGMLVVLLLIAVFVYQVRLVTQDSNI